MYQCCKVCKLLKYQEVEAGTISIYAPDCPHFDFIEHFNFYPESDGGTSGLTDYANSQGCVEIGNSFYRARFTVDEYTSKETPRSVEKLFDVMGFKQIEVPRISDEEMKALALEASGYQEPEWKMSEEDHEEYLMELAEDDYEPEDQPWHEFSAGNRNGVMYEYLGNFHDAFIEPFLWGHACPNGIHKFTGSVFTDEIEINGRFLSPMIVEKIAKVFYAEMLLKKNKEAKKCSACLLPVDEDETMCPFCKGNVDVTPHFQKAMGLLSSLDFQTVSSLNKAIPEIANLLESREFLIFIKNHTPNIKEPATKKKSQSK